MSAKRTWFWIFVAAGLFAFIFFFERPRHSSPAGPALILPNLKPATVTALQVRPPGADELEIRVERTNDTWQLTSPLVYPAQAASIEGLLTFLEKLTPAAYITADEIGNRPKAEEEYGFGAAQASIVILQGRARTHLLVGGRTAPGDQVFLQVVGVPGAYVVDADLLQFLPKSANDWRDTTLVNLEGLAFDRVAVTNNSRAFVLQRDPTNHLWRMVWPFTQGVRADNTKIENALEKLRALRVHQFVSDDPKTDLEPLGLAPPELELALGQGTNTVALLQFGKSPTNAPDQVYARRPGLNAVCTVDKDLQEAWRSASINDFRDPHLLPLTEAPQLIEVRGPDSFSLERQTNNTWRILPENLPADTALVNELVRALHNLRIVQFAQDVVNPPDLPRFGLASPVRQFILKGSSPSAATNVVLAEVDFGTNQNDKIFARLPDESSVYAVKRADFQRLPTAGWQLRDRKLWHFAENDVARLTLRQEGRVRQLIHDGPHAWSLAPGSQGSIEDLAVDQTVLGLVNASAVVWTALGKENLPRYGFIDNDLQVTMELKNKEKATIEFGGAAPSGSRYAAVTLDGKLWIFEFPWDLYYRYVATYLSVPR